MAKFCTKCGKKLEEGKKCDCTEVKKTKKVEENNTEKVTEKVTEASEKVNEVITVVGNNEYVKQVTEIAKNIFVKPLSVVKKYASNKNINLGYILMAVAIVAQALFVTISTDKYVGDMVDELDGNNMGASLLLGTSMYSSDDEDLGFFENIIEIDDEADEIEDYITVKVVNVFLYSAGITLASYGLLLGCIYVIINSVMKKAIDIKKTLVTLSLVAMINAIANLVALVLVFIYAPLAYLVLGLSGIYFTVMLYHNLLELENLDKNKFGLMFTGIYALYILVTYIIIQVII